MAANGSSPLLRLLNSVIAGERADVQSAMREVEVLLGRFGENLPFDDLASPLESTEALCASIQLLCKVCPTLVQRESERDGSLPLHFAASLGIPKVAGIIYSHYPDGAAKPNKKGKIPLHYAAREGRTEMVKFFLQTVPGCATIASDKQKLALHFAAGEGHTEIVRYLLEAYPRGASAMSAKGKTPLHLCARWGHLQVAYDLLSYYPEGVRALDWEYNLPLHDAAREGQYHMCRYLQERFHSALAVKNIRNEIPLFPAVRSGNLNLVCLLVQAWPRGAMHVLQNVTPEDSLDNWDVLEVLLRGATNNLDGCRLLRGRESPLLRLQGQTMTQSPSDSKPVCPNTSEPQLASWDGPMSQDLPQSSLEIASQDGHLRQRTKSPVLSSGPNDEPKEPARKKHRARDRAAKHAERVATRPPPKFFPLHAAFVCSVSPFLYDFILKERPDEKLKEDDHGRLPLHYAVAYCKKGNEAITQLVLSKLVTPAAASARDKLNMLPLHAAITARADERVIEALLEAFPSSGVEACKTLNLWHDVRPLHMALDYHCETSTIYLLVRADPSHLNSLM